MAQPPGSKHQQEAVERSGGDVVRSGSSGPGEHVG